ncbi:sacsin N-terminal ATP-binding-like domain-containing protein [Actinopolymorpha pittospori]
MTDPFATAEIRDRVLASWSASPARFREDANAEEDLALGGYRDRLVVELAQNAADAAARAGVPGLLRFTLRDDPRAWEESGGPVLVAENTGAPLTAEGVEALATLRASAKRDEPFAAPHVVGRFGVGFAAVLAVTDEPTVLSRTGGVRFSRDDTAALVGEAAEASPALAEEVRRRGGHVPTLRLPFAAEGEPPAGFETAVVLPLRDEAAADLVRRLLTEADDALLLALPQLERIEIDLDGGGGPFRVLADAGSRWHSARTGGTWTPAERAALLADRPTEERDRPYWSVLWAVPRDGTPADPLAGIAAGRTGGMAVPETGGVPGLPGVVHAPTPTDEPLSLPALLLASFPLDPTRRHVAPGPLTDRLVEEAAAAYADLARSRAEAGADALGLVPVGLPVGRLDGALRDGILRLLPATPLLPSVEDPHTLLRPRDAVVVEGADEDLVRMLASVVGGLVSLDRRDRAASDALGVRRLPLADLVDELSAVADAHGPRWWHDLYVALAATVADPERREALGALPVPLADGRIARGARGLLLPGGAQVPAEASSVLAAYGLRLVHPLAGAEPAFDTLERLGAVPASPRSLLEDGAVRAAVNDSPEADDPAQVADAVLALVAAAVRSGDLEPGDLPWLGDLALPDDTGELAPASALVLPGSQAEAIFDPEDLAPLDVEVFDRWGEDALEAAGVVRTLGLVSASDVDLAAPPDELAELDDIETWASEASEALDRVAASGEGAEGGRAFGGTVGELLAVRDADFVRDDAWPRALMLLTREPALRRALVEPARLLDVEEPDLHAVDVPSYTSWWVRRHVQVEGRPLTAFADPDADPTIAALLRAAPEWLAAFDPTARRALGLVRSVADLDTEGVRRVLRGLADLTIVVDAGTMVRLWAELGSLDPVLAASGLAPERIRVLVEGETRVVEADDAVIVDSPMWAQRTDLGGHVIASGSTAETLAELLDLPIAAEIAAGEISDGGEPRDVPDAVRRLLPDVPTTWWEHDDLLVDGHPVQWWVGPDGRPHAATGDGLARALAWATGRWELRHALATVLAEPDQAATLLVEAAFDPSV